MAYALIISRGIRSLPMLKCSSERWVWAPQSLSAGTSTTPRLSVSFLISVMGLSPLRFERASTKGGKDLLQTRLITTSRLLRVVLEYEHHDHAAPFQVGLWKREEACRMLRLVDWFCR